MRALGFRDLTRRPASFDDLLGNTGPTAARPPQTAALALVARDGLDVAGPMVDTSIPPGAPGLHTIFPDGQDVMPTYLQRGNGCGTTSLAMILSYTAGRAYSQAEVDREIRRLDVFTSPGDVVACSRKQGLNAEGYNRGSPEELRRFLDRGIPLQVVVNASKDASNIGALHYLAVVGYVLGDGGEIAGLRVHDPATGGAHTLAIRDFMEKWGAARPGFDHFFIAHAPKQVELPPGRWDGMREVLTVADSATSLLNNVDRIIHPGSVGDFLQGAVSLKDTVTRGLPAAVASIRDGVVRAARQIASGLATALQKLRFW
jgi:hypothetical protein